MPLLINWFAFTLQWRHNERDGVSNHRRIDCLLNHADQRKHQSSTSLAFVREIIHRRPVNSLHKGPVTRKMFLLHFVIMACIIYWFHNSNLQESWGLGVGVVSVLMLREIHQKSNISGSLDILAIYMHVPFIVSLVHCIWWVFLFVHHICEDHLGVMVQCRDSRFNLQRLPSPASANCSHHGACAAGETYYWLYEAGSELTVSTS